MRNNKQIPRRGFLRMVGFAVMGAAINSCSRIRTFLTSSNRKADATLEFVEKATLLTQNDLNNKPAAIVNNTNTDAKPSAPVDEQFKVDFLASHEVLEGDTSRLVVMMTYDDNAKFFQVETILKAFRKYPGSRATFFFEGEKIHLSIKAVKAILADGHTLGCHGWDHLTPLSKLKDSQIDFAFERCFEDLEKVVPGYRFQFVRFPFGDSQGNQRVLRIAAQWGMQHVYWTMGSNGLTKSTYNIVASQVKPGSIVLSHMFRKYDVEQAEMIVDKLIDMGYSLESIETGRKPVDIFENYLGK